MKEKLLSLMRRAFKDQRGQVLPWAAVGMVGVLGMSGFAIDLGRAYVVHSELQSSTMAAALAGAEVMPNSVDAINTAVAVYASQKGGKNLSSDLGIVTMSTPKTLCLTAISNMGIVCGGSAKANAVQVTQSASVQTYLLRVLGVKSIPVSTTATAAPGKPVPYNVAVIIDTTLSMNAQDNSCGNTQMNCALSGFRNLLKGLTPSINPVSVFTFPNVTVETSSKNYNCTLPVPNPTRSNGYRNDPIDGIYVGNYVILPTPPFSGIATATSYSFPAKGASSYSPSTKDGTPTYQIVPFSYDYRTSDTEASLSSSSNLVKAAGGVSGCNGMAPSNYDGNYGTYYAGVIYAAQSALVAEQQKNKDSQNALIILSDGNATAPSSTMPSAGSSGKYPSYNGQCGQAVDAAQYAAGEGTKVFSIAYGSQPSGCSSDQSSRSTHPYISPCETMKQMASASNYFYSDYNAQGSDVGCKSDQSTADMSDIFTTILGNLTGARIIANDTK